MLGGTGEARRLASALVAAGVDVLSSLAGRVADPVLPEGRVRVGGFGGAEGLAAWLAEHRPAAVVDATHPFADTMTAHAAEAARATGTPLLRLQRPGWREQPGDDWRWVDSLPEAAAAVAGFAHVFVTTGRTGLGAFAGLRQEVLLPGARRVALLVRGVALHRAAQERVRRVLAVADALGRHRSGDSAGRGRRAQAPTPPSPEATKKPARPDPLRVRAP